MGDGLDSLCIKPPLGLIYLGKTYIGRFYVMTVETVTIPPEGAAYERKTDRTKTRLRCEIA